MSDRFLADFLADSFEPRPRRVDPETLARTDAWHRERVLQALEADVQAAFPGIETGAARTIVTHYKVLCAKRGITP